MFMFEASPGAGFTNGNPQDVPIRDGMGKVGTLLCSAQGWSYCQKWLGVKFVFEPAWGPRQVWGPVGRWEWGRGTIKPEREADLERPAEGMGREWDGERRGRETYWSNWKKNKRRENNFEQALFNLPFPHIPHSHPYFPARSKLWLSYPIHNK